MNAGELLKLAERCEAASGADRELDAEIFAALRAGQEWMHTSEQAQRVWAPKYTASLDTALTLVPEGLRRVEFGTYENGQGWAYVHSPADHVGECNGADSEALALTAASLRALAQTEGR